MISKLQKKIQTSACVFTFSAKLEKLSSDVAYLPRTGKNIFRNKRAREGCAKLLVLLIKYAKFVALSLPASCCRSLKWYYDQKSFLFTFRKYDL